eukprot:COSAG02_NODE_321_length_24780_cov_11.623962_10_plen_127_part_00
METTYKYKTQYYMTLRRLARSPVLLLHTSISVIFCTRECSRCVAGVTMPSSSTLAFAAAPRLDLRVLTWVGSDDDSEPPALAARVLRVPIVRVLAGADLSGDCIPRVPLLLGAGATVTSSSTSCLI